MAIKYFIDPNTSLLNVNGIVLAGSAEFKDHLNDPKVLDMRILSKVIAIVDVAYGFKQGLQQAVELTVDDLKGVSLMNQKKLMAKFFSEISQDTGRYCFGIRDCLYSCEAGAVEILIVYENLETERFVVSTPEGDKVLYLNAEQSEKQENFKDAKTGQDYEVLERSLLVEWLAENYKKFGCSLQFVTDRSQEGMQFVKGFGGIGALLRYKLDFNTLDEDEARKDEDDEYDFFY